MNSYREIGESFCKHYYENIKNPDSIANLYNSNALITHNGEEILGYEKYRLKLKFMITPQTVHTPVKIFVQPMGDSIVITVLVNRINSFIKTSYVETFVLSRFNGNLFIVNNIIADI